MATTGIDVPSFIVGLLLLSAFFVLAIIFSLLFTRDMDLPETERDSLVFDGAGIVIWFPRPTGREVWK
jgi:hypothetical protein